MTRTHDTHFTNSNPPGSPSPELIDRAADGLARFMARWEDPDIQDEQASDDSAAERP